MREIPQLFQTQMVQAIIKKLKWMTRRLKGLNKINEWPNRYVFDKFVEDNKGNLIAHFYDTAERHLVPIKCPYGKPGDMLWVRETHIWDWEDYPQRTKKYFVYKASTPDYQMASGEHWLPSIHMPKEAARIWLRVTNIRVERLQDISEEDVKAEGVYMQPFDDPIEPKDFSYCPNCGGQFVHGAFGENYGVTEVDCTTCDTYKKRFKILWGQINGPESWEQNVWVWVVQFEILSTTSKPKEQGGEV